MTGAEIVALLRKRLVRGTSPTIQNDEWWLEEVVQAEKRLYTRTLLPWFLLRERSTEQVLANEDRVEVPQEMLTESESDEMELLKDGVYVCHLRKKLYDQIVRIHGQALGSPRDYALQGKYFRLRPIPDSDAYSLRMTYLARWDYITMTTSSPWSLNASDLLIAEAGVVLAQTLGNVDGLGTMQALRAQENMTLDTRIIARAEANANPNPEE